MANGKTVKAARAGMVVMAIATPTLAQPAQPSARPGSERPAQAPATPARSASSPAATGAPPATNAPASAAPSPTQGASPSAAVPPATGQPTRPANGQQAYPQPYAPYPQPNPQPYPNPQAYPQPYPPGYPQPYRYPPPYGVPYPPEPPPPPPPPPPKTRHVTLSLSPLHLLLPVVEVTAEFRLTPWAGIAPIGGVGVVSVTEEDGDRMTFTFWEAGGQVDFYFMRDFRGLHAGVEVLYAHLSTSDLESGIAWAGNGWALGPLVGYKLLTEVGFTFVGQVGVQYQTARAREENPAGDTASDQDSTFVPLLNANLGWSF
jgi:hypothetical protein